MSSVELRALVRALCVFVCVRCFSLLILNFDLSSNKQPPFLFCVEFPPKKNLCEKKESFPHKKEDIYKTQSRETKCLCLEDI